MYDSDSDESTSDYCVINEKIKNLSVVEYTSETSEEEEENEPYVSPKLSSASSKEIKDPNDENECSEDANKTTEEANEAIPERQDAWRMSFFRRAFPVEKYEDCCSRATKKVSMDERRPLWIPRCGRGEDVPEPSYFSEILAKDQLRRQAVLDKIYRPQFGQYAHSRSDLVGRTYISKHMNGAHCCKFSPDGQHLVIGCGSGTIQIRDMKTNATSEHCIKGHHGKITSIRFLPNGSEDCKTFLASSLTGRVYIGRHKGKQWKLYPFLKEIGNEINAMDLNFNGTHMATAGKDSHIRIYDPNRKKLVQMYLKPGTLTDEEKDILGGIPDEGHFRRICALKFLHDDENVFITGGWDDIVKVWDMRVLNPVLSILGPHLAGNSIDVWGRVILTGQWTCNEGIQLWDMRRCKCVHVVQPLNRPSCFAGEFINDVQFFHSWDGSPNQIPGISGDLILAVGSGTKALEVISIKENMILHSTEEANAVISVDHFRSLIAYGSANHLYGIVSFFPFVGTLPTEMKFRDKETDDAKTKYFSSYQNLMKWQEKAIDMDFLKKLKKLNKNVEKEDSNFPKCTIEGNMERQYKKKVPETYSIKVPHKL